MRILVNKGWPPEVVGFSSTSVNLAEHLAPARAVKRRFPGLLKNELLACYFVRENLNLLASGTATLPLLRAVLSADHQTAAVNMAACPVAVGLFIPVKIAFYRLTSQSFTQTSETILDVSGYGAAAILTQILAIDLNRGTTKISLDTAIENRDGQWTTLGDLESLSTPPTLPRTTMKCLQATSNSGTWTGFARYLRIRVSQQPGASISFNVMALLK